MRIQFRPRRRQNSTPRSKRVGNKIPDPRSQISDLRSQISDQKHTARNREIWDLRSGIWDLRKENLKVKTRIFFVSLVFITASVIFFAPAHSKATQSATIWVWCMSDTSAPTVYFGGPFDSGMTTKSGGMFNGLSLGRQFGEYLKGRYDTKGDPSGITAASCSRGVNSIDQAAAMQRMREVMTQMRQ